MKAIVIVYVELSKFSTQDIRRYTGVLISLKRNALYSFLENLINMQVNVLHFAI